MCGWRFCFGLILLSTLCCATACRQTAVPAAEVEASLGEYVTIYDAGVRVRMPQGFSEAHFSGYANRENKCVLIARKLPTAFNAAFDKHANSLQKKKTLSREKVTVNGLEGVLLHTEESVPDGAGTIIRRTWDCVFGDQTESALVSAVYYDKLPPLVSASLRAAVLSAQRDDSPPPKPGDRQSFMLPSSTKLKLVDESWKYYAYSEDGVVPTKSIESPLLQAGNFPYEHELDFDRRAFAEKMLRSERGLEQFDIKSCEEITLDGVAGYELFATAVHGKSDTAIVLYYVVLFQPKEYIMISGYCGASFGESYQPEFKAMAHGMKLKSKRE